MNLFEVPIFVMTMGLEGTSDIQELHEIAEELNLVPWQEEGE